MKYMLTSVLLILTLFSCSEGESEDPVKDSIEKKQKLFGIILNDNAAVRFQPQLYTSRVDFCNKGDNVLILDHSAEKSKIGGVTDYWYKISLPSGSIGWTFGSNLKLMKEGDDFSIDDYKKQVAQEKIERTLKQLKGKWWSVTRSGNFTSHMLMIYPDNTYKSSRHSVKKEGTFTLDMDSRMLTFSEGTSFGDKLGFYTRGQELVLEIETEERTYRFKKISSETDEEKEERLDEYKIEDLEPEEDSSSSESGSEE